MKKYLAILLAALMLMACAACGAPKDTDQPVDAENTDQLTNTENTDDSSANAGDVAQLGAVTLPDSISFEDYDAQYAVREANPVDDGTIDAVNAFAYESAVKILNDCENKSGCFSPLSLYYALAIAASGASGDTQAQLLSALGMADAQTLSTQCGNLFRNLYADNDIVKLTLANSLWVDDEFSPKDAFVQNAVENFYAETYSADLSTQKAMDAMAQWVNAHTNDMLDPQFEPSESLLMSIINTIYFNDQWTDNFDEEDTVQAPFYLADGTTAQCDMMSRTFANHSYLKGNDYAKTSLNLTDGSKMVFVLPDEGVDVYSFLSDAQKLETVLNAEEDVYGDVKVSLPKFDNSSDLELTDALKAMGITSAFDKDADFSGITDGDCFISAVQHQCRVSVNENGVEAAAYTAIMMCGTGLMTGSAEITFDRPFLYSIVDQTGAVLFVGVCMNPAA